jgi:hypothetical protein
MNEAIEIIVATEAIASMVAIVAVVLTVMNMKMKEDQRSVKVGSLESGKI